MGEAELQERGEPSAAAVREGPTEAGSELGLAGHTEPRQTE